MTDDSSKSDKPHDYPQILRQIAKAIEALKPEFPQLVDFDANAITDDSIFYDFNAEPDPTIRAGWRRGFPLPKSDGVVIWIRFLDDERTRTTQDVFIPAKLGEMTVPVYVMDGDNTKPVSGRIREIMRRHGWREISK